MVTDKITNMADANPHVTVDDMDYGISVSYGSVGTHVRVAGYVRKANM